MQEWQDYASSLFSEKIGDLWVWFDALNREEWLLVMGVCCAAGFLFLKSRGQSGPC